ncbi:MAG: AIR synthase-related protein, partial [Nitrospinota bacterium]
ATYVANEGKMVLIVDESDADKTLSIMKKNSLGQSATIVGKVVKKRSSNVFIESLVGGARIVHKLQGEILPRIC